MHRNREALGAYSEALAISVRLFTRSVSDTLMRVMGTLPSQLDTRIGVLGTFPRVLHTLMGVLDTVGVS